MRVPLLNYEVGPGVPLLKFTGVLGPTFKLWGGSRVSGLRSWGPESWGPGPLLRFACLELSRLLSFQYYVTSFSILLKKKCMSI